METMKLRHPWKRLLSLLMVLAMLVSLMGVTAFADLDDGYYLVGSMNGWSASAGYKLTPNPNTAGEYYLNTSLTAGSEFKVRAVVDGAEAGWYPSDGGNCTYNSAGAVTVYFRPGYDGGSDWHCGCLYVATGTLTLYTVTFDSNGGSAVSPQTIATGSKATAPADPYREGFTFVGWYAGDDLFDFDNTPINSDITLTARWEEITHTVTFINHSEVVATETVADGDTVTPPALQPLDGSEHVGWIAEGETELFDFDTPITSDLTLTAKWIPVLPPEPPVLVSFNSDGGTPVPDAQQIEAGDTATEPYPEPTKEGFTFAGWYAEGATLPFDFLTPLSQSIILTAHWEAVPEPVASVAQIGEMTYETLEAAIEAASAGDTITLLDDVDMTGDFDSASARYPISKSLTIDGAGHTITVAGRGFGVGMNASAPVDVTFKDVTILNGINGGRCVDTRGNLNSLTLNGVTLKTTGTSGYLQPLTIGGNQASAATVTITNSTISTSDDASKGYAIITFNPVNMTITGSTIKGWACLYPKGPDGSAGSAGSVINVSGSTLVSKNVYPGDTNAFGMIKIEDNNVQVNITSSTININGAANSQAIVSYYANSGLTGNTVSLGAGNTVTMSGDAVFAENDSAGSLSVSGGTFNVPVPAEVCAEGFVPQDNGDGTYGVTEATYVAQIGSVKYESLADAVAAVPAGGTATITMIDNEAIDVSGSGITIPAGKNITIDLNGHTVVGTAEGSSSSALITNKGTLTIKDSGEGGKLLSGATPTWEYGGDGNYAGSYASNTITNSGTLYIQSGHIENLSTGSACFAIDNNSSGGNAIVNISGGTVKATSVAIREFANSTTLENTVNISGGTVQAGYSGIWIQLPGNDNTKAMKAALNVTGGTITGGSYAFYDYSYGNSYSETQFTLSGGTFDGTVFSFGANIAIEGGTFNDDVAIKQSSAPSTVSVTGGHFAGDVYTYGTYASEGFISGGTFETTTYEDEGTTYDCDWLSLLADGYTYEENEDGDYVVREAHYVAQIGDVKYESFAEAVAARTDDDTVIELLDAISDPYTLESASSVLKVQKNGKSITVKAPEGAYALKTSTANGVTTYSVV
ncbi:MAG: InlB B-repeat-containing protein, partial [Oscillospiraceae bacterium]|nr:InlB B-repeat-containing protein [Oscillospiraceae bacterium]